MLSRDAHSRLGLICSNCGTPVRVAAEPGGPHPLLTGLTLVGLASFSLLLFVLTNLRPLPLQQATRQQGLIRPPTTGTLVSEPEPLERGSGNGALELR